MGRLYIAPLGEAYEDALRIEAWLKNRTVASEASSLLSARLMSRQSYREKMIGYLATKRGISPEELTQQILSGEAKPMESDPND